MALSKLALSMWQRILVSKVSLIFCRLRSLVPSNPPHLTHPSSVDLKSQQLPSQAKALRMHQVIPLVRHLFEFLFRKRQDAFESCARRSFCMCNFQRLRIKLTLRSYRQFVWKFSRAFGGCIISSLRAKVSMNFKLTTAYIFSIAVILAFCPFGFAKTEAECLEDIRLGTELIKSSPNDFRGYASRGCAFGYLKKYDLAEKDILKALSLKPGTAGLYSHLASAYHGMGRYEEAISACSKVIEFGLRTQAAYNAWLASLYEGKQFAECIKQSDVVLLTFPKDGTAYFYRALCKSELGIGSRKSILADMEKASSLEPGDKSIKTQYEVFKKYKQ